MAPPNPSSLLEASSFFQFRELPEDQGDHLENWRKERRSRIPLRAALEAKSDFGFGEKLCAELSDRLTEEGIDPSCSSALVSLVLAEPTFAITDKSGKDTTIVQAAVVRRNDELGLPFEILVRVHLEVRGREHVPGQASASPARVVTARVACEILDMEDDINVGLLMERYVEMARGRGEGTAQRTLHRSVLMLGNPRELGSADTPDNWQEELKTLAQAFGARVTFERGPSLPAGVPKALIAIFRFEPYSGELPKREGANEEVKHFPIDARVTSYKDIFRQIATHLNDHEPEEQRSEFAPRALQPGERIYHRKIGNSSSYDRFNLGSSEPCQHTTEYIRYYNSDKAVKGFQRRYTNFDPSWMRHCKQGSCGMYAVFCPESST